MTHKKLRALALAGAVTGASLMASGGAIAAPQKWGCKDDLRPGSSFERSHCGYGQYPLGAPSNILPNITPPPGPDPTPPYTP